MNMEQILEKLTEGTPKIIAAAGKNRRSLAALGIIAACVIAVAYFRAFPGYSQTVGSDSVVMGQVQPNAHVGDRSVVIGATDGHGNVMLTQPMIVGHNAHGGPGDIVIGADAGGGQTAITEPPRNSQVPEPESPKKK